MNSYCRELIKDIDIEPFVRNILGISDLVEVREAINLIAEAENCLNKYYQYQTYTSDNYRDFQYRSAETRNILHEKIIYDLITKKRPQNDEDYKLEIGGCLPRNSPPLPNRTAYYVIGLPASGKSGICNKIADETNSILLDSDIAKRKFLEYNNKKGGATLVHEESDKITFTDKKFNLLEYCTEKGYNIVIAKIGHNQESVLDIVQGLKKAGYNVNIILVDLSREKATQRAYKRFKDTGRYVPLSLIFDGYSNEPILTYYRLRQIHMELFSGYAQISTDVAFTAPVKIIESNLDYLHHVILG